METNVKQVDLASLRIHRKAAKLSQTAIGEVLGLGKAMVAHYESGHSLITADQLALWAQACRVEDMNKFFTFAPPKAVTSRKTVKKV